MPVVSFSWIFIAIPAMGIICGLSSILELMKPLTDSMGIGEQLFGIYGAAMAGQAKIEAMRNLKNMNPALYDVEDYTGLLLFTSIILGVIITLLSGLTIARTKGKNKLGVNILSVFYFVSGLSATAIIVLYCTLLIAENASEHYSDPHYILPNTLLSVALISSLIFYYIMGYRSTLTKMVAGYPRQMQYNSQDTIHNITAPNLKTYNTPDMDKPTKICPFCGETILAVAVKCKHCGEWLPKEEEKKMVECPVCGEMVQEGTDVCPYCHERMKGSSLQQKESNVRMIACPVCAEQIPDNIDICPICNEKIK